MHYNFLAPPQIVFGWGRRSEVGTLAARLGRRALLVVGSRTLAVNGEVDRLRESLAAAGLTVETFTASAGEPEVAHVDALVAQWRALPARTDDCVIALGGGSTIDLAKAAAALVTQTQAESVLGYLEGVGRGLTISASPLPLLALPTTAGTGSEATKNAVISSYDPVFKKSLRDDRMIPRIVLVDPELTVSVPADITAATGMDAITQLIESFISRRAAPIPQALCRHGLQLAWPALPRAIRDGGDRPAREAMAHAALLSGMALANSGLGVAHGVAAALGATCRTTHGLACAVMLPTALRINRHVRQTELSLLAGDLLGRSSSSATAAVDALIDHVTALCHEFSIPQRLRDLGVASEQIPLLVERSQGNSLSGNPRELTHAELRDELEALW